MSDQFDPGTAIIPYDRRQYKVVVRPTLTDRKLPGGKILPDESNFLVSIGFMDGARVHPIAAFTLLLEIQRDPGTPLEAGDQTFSRHSARTIVDTSMIARPSDEAAFIRTQLTHYYGRPIEVDVRSNL
jgi:hypothetical protein